jgi:sulfatase maturation enzyme AslB (radical SAM superfamily)
MEKKYFPIKTASACQLKWSWSTLYLAQSLTASCCHAGHSPLSVENFSNFHNTDKKVNQRRLMLEGLWPDDCGYCKQHEDIGQSSYRTVSNQLTDQYPPELDIDLTAVEVTPMILEIYFNNTCNLSCVYCVPEISSKINQEYKKFGNFVKHGVSLVPAKITPNYAELLQETWTWLKQNSQKLKRFNVMGGEPFYQIEFDHCLNYFESTVHPDLELSITTNLIVAHDKLIEYVNKFKSLLSKQKLKSINIICSIDCAGAEQEYVRWGIDLALWKKNFEYLMQQKWLTLNINQAVSLLTIKSMPVLLEQLQEWNKIRNIGHFLTPVNNPAYLKSNLLGDFFNTDFEHILKLMLTDTELQLEVKSFMSSMASEASQSQRDIDKLLDLKIFLTENDSRRGSDWKSTFPWLVPELENLHVV